MRLAILSAAGPMSLLTDTGAPKAQGWRQNSAENRLPCEPASKTAAGLENGSTKQEVLSRTATWNDVTTQRWPLQALHQVAGAPDALLRLPGAGSHRRHRNGTVATAPVAHLFDRARIERSHRVRAVRKLRILRQTQCLTIREKVRRRSGTVRGNAELALFRAELFGTPAFRFGRLVVTGTRRRRGDEKREHSNTPPPHADPPCFARSSENAEVIRQQVPCLERGRVRFVEKAGNRRVARLLGEGSAGKTGCARMFAHARAGPAQLPSSAPPSGGAQSGEPAHSTHVHCAPSAQLGPPSKTPMPLVHTLPLGQSESSKHRSTHFPDRQNRSAPQSASVSHSGTWQDEKTTPSQRSPAAQSASLSHPAEQPVPQAKLSNRASRDRPVQRRPRRRMRARLLQAPNQNESRSFSASHGS